jgi:hypothetical protein
MQPEAAMRTFELRLCKLRSKEALDFYAEQICPFHLSSFPLFGIEAHGFWTAKEDVEPRIFVLDSYAAGERRSTGRRYSQRRRTMAPKTIVAERNPTWDDAAVFLLRRKKR